MSTPIRRMLVLLTALLASPSVAPAHGVVRYDGGRWFDGTGFQERVFFSVEGILRARWEGTVDAIVDLQGRFVIPPLGDAHTHHFADGTDGSESTAAFLRDGVFYAKNPNNLPGLAARAEAVNTPGGVDVIYSHGGLTSTGGHPVPIYDRLARHASMEPEEMRGKAYFLIDDADDLAARWPRILEGKPDFLKVYLEHSEEHEERRGSPAYHGRRGLDPGLLPAVVRRAHAAGITVSAHVATAADFRTAVRAGVDEINHLPLERLTAADARLAARRKVHVVTTTISHRPVEDAAAAREVYRHNIEVLRDAGVVLLLGTDAHPTVAAEIESIAAMGVLDARALLVMAVETTPRALFPGRKIGRLADGWEASFLVLERNPLESMGNLASIVERVKQGRRLELAEEAGLPSIAEALTPVLMSQGADAAIARYHELRRTEPDAWDFSEEQLNALGYALLSHGQIHGAVRIFELNARVHPEAFNVWDSLAEAWMKAGERDRAIRSYRRSLELNPENANAVMRLRELGVEP